MVSENAAQTDVKKKQRGVAAVFRALAILEALETANMPRNLSEIARATGLYKSTILRILESLQDEGYVVKVEDSRYALGPRIMQLGIAYESSNPLRHHVLPTLEKIVAQGTESASFHVRQNGQDRLCLFRENSRHSTLDRVDSGDRLPVRRGAAGKVLLAFGDEKEPGGEMDEIRTSCIAISLGERDKLCAGMAAPVFSGGQRLIGALSLSGPKERFQPGDLERMKPQLLDAAREITGQLGGTYPL
jgi:DNA-binding IclR family transcriptional regulator